MCIRLPALLAIIIFAALPAYADTVFPEDAGYIDVRNFGAKGDGRTDDTAAINAALTASGGDAGPTFWHDRIVYFPNGTYLVSAPIIKRYPEDRYGSGSILVGQSREKTIIRLKDKAEGYDNPKRPKPVIFTTAKLLDGNATSGGKDYVNKGEGNDAFMNFVEHMTIDVGAGNPGAIGIDYLANNIGAIRDVTVKAPKDSGVIGISMTRKWPGPALLQNVLVQGFDIGMAIDNTEYGLTLDRIRLEGARSIGLRNDHNAVSASELTIIDTPLALQNVSKDGLVVVHTGTFSGVGGEAIENEGYLNLRSITLTGYETALGAPVAGALDGVYEGKTRLSNAAQDWSLPVKSAPVAVDDNPRTWASVTKFGADPSAPVDSTFAIRRAFSSGASTVYFPHGIYYISDNIIIPEHVRRIVGMTSTIQAVKDRPERFRRDLGMFRAANTKAPLVIEKLAFDNSYLGDQVGVEAMGSRPLVLRDIIGAGVTTLSRPRRAGEAFIENTCCGTIDVAGPAGVWARQLDTEGGGVRMKNAGAPFWLLGLKSEYNNTTLENSDGARSEILGGLIYIPGFGKADPAIPAFKNTDSRILLSYMEESFRQPSTYAVHLHDTQKGKITETKSGALPKRTIGRMVPQVVAR